MDSEPSTDLEATPAAQGAASSRPLFTLVVPTRDRPEQLRRCLNALQRLKAPSGPVELVLVDDGSTPPIQAEFGSLEGVLLRRNGDGPARARNAGAKQARGEYLAFLDDDCEPDEQWLVELEYRIQASQAACLGGAVHNALPENDYSSASQLLVDYLYEVFEGTSEHFFCSNNLCVPRKAFADLGGFDEGFPLPAAEDRDFCIRWQEAGRPLEFVPDAIVLHSHPMGLRGFWRQHYRYGRGAYQFHRTRSQRAGEALRLEPFAFYWNLLRFPFRKLRFTRAVPVCALFVVSQFANALGFFRERASVRSTRAQQPSVVPPPVGGRK